LEHEDGIHRAVSCRHDRDGRCLVGPRTLAPALFAATLLASVATYLHHASDVLKLSF
jgi:hypothetical protein